MSLVRFFIEIERRYESGKRNIFQKEKTEQEVLQEFHMTKQEIYYLCDVGQVDKQSMRSRYVDLTLLDKVLICVKTLASGSL